MGILADNLKAARDQGNEPYATSIASKCSLSFDEIQSQFTTIKEKDHLVLLLETIFEAGDREHAVSELVKRIPVLAGIITKLIRPDFRPLSVNASVFVRDRVANNKVFLVHGHDHRLLGEVATFLRKIIKKVVILSEEANKGKTIIEKFEHYSDVGFAVALLTPDDRGGACSESEFHPRARQNVIFELGYFTALLGRERVAVLFDESVELPSDYSGIMYVKIDSEGGWKMKLAKELRSSGLLIDMNEAI